MERFITINTAALLSAVPAGTKIKIKEPGYGVPEEITAVGEGRFRDNKGKTLNSRQIQGLLTDGTLNPVELAKLSGMKLRTADGIAVFGKESDEVRDILLFYMRADRYEASRITSPGIITAYAYDIICRSRIKKENVPFIKSFLLEKPCAILRADSEEDSAFLIISDKTHEDLPETMEMENAVLTGADCTNIIEELIKLSPYVIYADNEFLDTRLYEEARDKDPARRFNSDTARELNSKPLPKADAGLPILREILKEAKDEREADRDVPGEDDGSGVSPEIRKRLKKMEKKTTLEEIRENIRKRKG